MPARELAENRHDRDGYRACSGPGMAPSTSAAVAVELGGVGTRCVKRVLGQRTAVATLRCRIAPFYRSRRRLRRRWPGVSAGLCLGEARPAHAGPHPQGTQISRPTSGTQGDAGGFRLPRRTIVPLPAAASRSLPAVASHAIGVAEPRRGGRSPGIGACRGRWSRAGPRVRRSLRCR